MKLPKHKGSLTLCHNNHKDYYMTAKEAIEENEDLYDWESEQHKQRAIDTNEIWTLQWYPDTPVGFLAAAAPTLEDLIDFVNREVE